MSLGLSHSLSRHKLKFSPDKVDTMIVQAIALLDDLDKELNTYAMRVKEWYGWHFPEMGRIVNDNLAYARVILKMGLRSNAANADLAEILPEEIEGAVKAAAEISMGTEITSEDLDNIQALAEQVVSFTEYRQQLSSYLSARMTAIAPNLTALVGELVGARLIAHAGSLINLAKSPASTIQILGAEKALFRALKTKHDTPKYGLIYHASLIGQASGKNKGKIARMLATKAALGLRVDALADWGTSNEGNGEEIPEEEKAALGIECRAKIERRLRALEGKPLRSGGVAIGPNGMTGNQPGKWEVKEARKYNRDADGLAGNEPAAASGRKSISDKKKPERDTDGDVKMIEEIDEDGRVKKRKRDEDEDESEAEVQGEDMVKDEARNEDRNEDGDMSEDEDEDEDDEDESDDEDDEEEKVKKPAPQNSIPKTAVNGTDQVKGAAPTISDLADFIPLSTTKQDHENKDEDEDRAALKAARREAKRIRKQEEKERELAKKQKNKPKKKIPGPENERIYRERKEKRLKKRAEIVASQPKIEPSQHGELAKKAGLTVPRFLKKYRLGKITWDKDGNPMALTKKQLRLYKEKQRALAKANAPANKAADATIAADEAAVKAAHVAAGGDDVETGGKKKRKRENDGGEVEGWGNDKSGSKKKKKKTKA